MGAMSAQPELFDAEWYLAQNPDIAALGLDPWRHYLAQGAWEMRNPHPLFDSQWYLESYPEVAAAGVNPLLHYLTAGAAEQRDPHPLFDTRTYREVCGRLPPGVTPLEAFVSGGRPACAGAYRSIQALTAVQRDFLDKVRVETVIDRRKNAAIWAVFLQCGQPSLHPRWLTSAPKPWHLIANFYDGAYNNDMSADLVLAQNLGTKFTAIHRLLDEKPDFFDDYEFVLFLDDDILVSEEAVSTLFRIADALSLKLAQAAVAPGSANTWQVLLRREDTIGRYLNTVEIMMPLISREALALGTHLFARSISGWGLDFALGDLVRRVFGSRSVAVIDAVSFLHAKPIDPLAGAYYRMLREHRISPLVEQRMMGLWYGASAPIEGLGVGDC